MVVLECSKVCVCKCCGGSGNRAECTCLCNKCTCARSRYRLKQNKIAGIEKPKKMKSHVPKPHVIKFMEISCTPRYTKKKPVPQGSVPRFPAPTSEYPKEVAEQTFMFCYDEELESRSIAEQTPAAKVPRPTPDTSWKGMHTLCVSACVFLHTCMAAFVCLHVDLFNAM
jgi:hypothetical protein